MGSLQFPAWRGVLVRFIAEPRRQRHQRCWGVGWGGGTRFNFSGEKACGGTTADSSRGAWTLEASPFLTAVASCCSCRSTNVLFQEVLWCPKPSLNCLSTSSSQQNFHQFWIFWFLFQTTFPCHSPESSWADKGLLLVYSPITVSGNTGRDSSSPLIGCLKKWLKGAVNWPNSTFCVHPLDQRIFLQPLGYVQVLSGWKGREYSWDQCSVCSLVKGLRRQPNMNLQLNRASLRISAVEVLQLKSAGTSVSPRSYPDHAGLRPHQVCKPSSSRPILTKPQF